MTDLDSSQSNHAIQFAEWIRVNRYLPIVEKLWIARKDGKLSKLFTTEELYAEFIESLTNKK
jgi:hypothetical protein